MTVTGVCDTGEDQITFHKNVVIKKTRKLKVVHLLSLHLVNNYFSVTLGHINSVISSH